MEVIGGKSCLEMTETKSKLDGACCLASPPSCSAFRSIAHHSRRASTLGSRRENTLVHQNPSIFIAIRPDSCETDTNGPAKGLCLHTPGRADVKTSFHRPIACHSNRKEPKGVALNIERFTSQGCSTKRRTNGEIRHGQRKAVAGCARGSPR